MRGRGHVKTDQRRGNAGRRENRVSPRTSARTGPCFLPTVCALHIRLHTVLAWTTGLEKVPPPPRPGHETAKSLATHSHQGMKPRTRKRQKGLRHSEMYWRARGWLDSSCAPPPTCLPRLQARRTLLATLKTHRGGSEDLVSKRQRSKTKTTVTSNMGFPGGSAVKNLPANAWESSSIPVSGRFTGEGNGNPFQYSCLEKDWGAWQATVHGVANSQTRLSDWTELNWTDISIHSLWRDTKTDVFTKSHSLCKH